MKYLSLAFISFLAISNNAQAYICGGSCSITVSCTYQTDNGQSYSQTSTREGNMVNSVSGGCYCNASKDCKVVKGGPSKKINPRSN